MDSDASPGASGSKPNQAPKLKPFLGSLPHHERRFLTALALIIESGKAKTIDELIKYCRQAREASAVDFIRNLAEQSLPVDLVFDAMCVHFRIVAHKRNNALLAACESKTIGMLLPLPPHILDTFLHFGNTCVLSVDGHHLPPNLERFSGQVCGGTRASRARASELDILVFEAFREKDDFLFPSDSGDVLDPRILKPEAKLIVHLRPHRDPNDIPVPFPAGKLEVL